MRNIGIFVEMGDLTAGRACGRFGHLPEENWRWRNTKKS